MNKLMEKKPIWYAVIWILIYIVIVNMGDGISEMIGVANSATSILLILLSIVLIWHLKKNAAFEFFGLKQIKKADYLKTLFFIPLIIMAFIQYSKGTNNELGVLDIIIGCILMICVGFIEELLFRGFLFQGILKNGNLTKAIIISGVTFGIGHVVNLMRGYSMADQAIQIVCAVFIGIVLACIVAITKSIFPGVIFHGLFNISGTITNNNLKMETYISIAIVVLSLLYLFYLQKSLKNKENISNLIHTNSEAHD